MSNKCEETKSYCAKMTECHKDGSIPIMIGAEARNTLFNEKRESRLFELGGSTVLRECDNTEDWFLRWWLHRYDYKTAIKITKECIDRKMDFKATDSPSDYYFLEKTLSSLYGEMATHVDLLKGGN